MKTKISFRHFLAFLRRQPRHMQHMYALAIAAISTGIVAAIILYADYGFWHEQYIAQDLLSSTTTPITLESPSEMIGRFWNDARTQFGGVRELGASLLQGTDTYYQGDNSATTTSP